MNWPVFILFIGFTLARFVMFFTLFVFVYIAVLRPSWAAILLMALDFFVRELHDQLIVKFGKPRP